MDAPFQGLTNQPSFISALYAKNDKEVGSAVFPTMFHTPPAFTPITITSNIWIPISTPVTQGSAKTVFFLIR